MSRILRLCLVTGLGVSGCRQEAPDLESCVRYIRTPTANGKVRYGAAHGELLIVIFEVFPAHGVAAIESELTPIIGPRRRGLLQVRRGSEETATATQLFEYVDGAYRESAANVTRQELEAFLDSKPREYGIQALLRFAGRED